jgi:hypothetical protein
MVEPRLVRDLPARKAREWRNDPLYIGTIGIRVHPYLEHLFGNVTLAAHKLSTPEGLLKYAAAFANDEETVSIPRAVFVRSDDGLGAMEIAKAIEPQLTEERIEAWRVRLRAILDAAFKEPAGRDDLDFNSQPKSFLQGVAAATEGQIEWKLSADRGIGLRIYGEIRGPDAFLGVIKGMLLEQKKRELLSRCRTCNRFFLIERTMGATRRVYCSKKCMSKAHANDNSLRQRNVYKRQQATNLLVESLGRNLRPDVAKDLVKRAFKARPNATYEQLAKHAGSLVQPTIKGTTKPRRR